MVVQAELQKKSMKVNGLKIKCLEMERIIFQMVLCIKGNGKEINNVDSECISFRMELSIKGSGRIILWMEQDTL